MLEIVAAVLAIGAVMAFNNWRNGLLACVAVGFIQDPIRKLVSGQPGYLSVLVIVVFALVCAAMLSRRVPMRLVHLYGRDKKLKNAWHAFIALIIIQSIMSFLNFGNPVISMLGLVNYLAPLAAMLVGFAYVRSPRDIERFFGVYAALAVPFALCVYLSSWYENQWDVLKDIGAFSGRRLVIYDQGTIMYSYSGLLRAGEYAAWHAAMSCVILFIFASVKRSFILRVVTGILIVLLIGAIVLTGRRKMVMALTIFLAMYTFLLAYFWYGLRNLAPLIITLCIIGSASLLLQTSDKKEKIYSARGGTVYIHIGERLETALDLFASAYERAGFFGVGAGVTAQGAGHFGVNEDEQVGIRGASEAGIGKVTAELGVPGLIVILWLSFRFVKHIKQLFKQTPKRYTRFTVILAALVSILIANAATYFVAVQLYGDLFVLLLLGLWTGFIFAIERMLQQSLQAESFAALQAQ